jgi:hypothetical protein
VCYGKENSHSAIKRPEEEENEKAATYEAGGGGGCNIWSNGPN